MTDRAHNHSIVYSPFVLVSVKQSLKKKKINTWSYRDM